jgi:hypothetical protein
MIEAVFVLPFLFFLLVGAYDWGFFAYALIATQDAARGAALYAATSATTAVDSTGACNAVLPNFAAVPNIGSSVTSCVRSPLIVTASETLGPDGAPTAVVTVTYTCMQLIPIPGLVTGNATISRTVQMKVRS